MCFFHQGHGFLRYSVRILWKTLWNEPYELSEHYTTELRSQNNEAYGNMIRIHHSTVTKYILLKDFVVNNL